MKLHAFFAPVCAAALLCDMAVPAFATTPTSVNSVITDVIAARKHPQQETRNDGRYQSEEIARRR